MNKYLEKIAEQVKEAMNPSRVIDAADKAGVRQISSKVHSKADSHLRKLTDDSLSAEQRKSISKRFVKAKGNASKLDKEILERGAGKLPDPPGKIRVTK